MTNKELEHYNKQEYKRKLAEIKEASGCVDCGINNHIILDFDHLKDKKYNISRMIHDGFSWAAIKKEVAKIFPEYDMETYNPAPVDGDWLFKQLLV